jgi:hypothetical protein
VGRSLQRRASAQCTGSRCTWPSRTICTRSEARTPTCSCERNPCWADCTTSTRFRRRQHSRRRYAASAPMTKPGWMEFLRGTGRRPTLFALKGFLPISDGST